MAKEQPELEPVELPPQGIYPGNEVYEEGDILLQWVLREGQIYKGFDFTIDVPEKTIKVEGSGWDMKTWRNFLEGIYFSALSEECPNTSMLLTLTINWGQGQRQDPIVSHHCDELQGVEHED